MKQSMMERICGFQADSEKEKTWQMTTMLGEITCN